MSKQKKLKLVQNVDYTIEYENNINVEGEHKIILHGIGDYYGDISKTFIINPKKANNLIIEAMPNMEKITEDMTEKISDAVIVRDGDLVVSKEDYDVTYVESVDKKGNNVIVVTIIPKRNYEGKANKAKESFNLIDIENKANASELTLSVLTGKGLKYTGKCLKPKVVVYDSKGKKVSSKNYKLVYSNNINAGIGSVYAVGKNDYYGISNRADFEILPKDFAKVKISKLNNIMFRKNVNDIHPIVKDGSNVLKENVDYTVSFDTKEGTSLFGLKSKKILVTITNISKNYTGKAKTTSLIITPRKISNTLYCTISVDNASLVDGKAEPKVIVKYSGVILQENEDYTIKYSNNKKAGKKGNVKITGIGNYTGSRTLKFNINASN